MARRKRTSLGRWKYSELDLKGTVLVIMDLLNGNSSSCLVTYVAGFSLIRVFCRYQV